MGLLAIEGEPRPTSRRSQGRIPPAAELSFVHPHLGPGPSQGRVHIGEPRADQPQGRGGALSSVCIGVGAAAAVLELSPPSASGLGQRTLAEGLRATGAGRARRLEQGGLKKN